jgi:hypothetical protein
MHNQQTVLSDDMYPTNIFYFYNSEFTSGSIQLTLSTKIQSINIIYMENATVFTQKGSS